MDFFPSIIFLKNLKERKEQHPEGKKVTIILTQGGEQARSQGLVPKTRLHLTQFFFVVYNSLSLCILVVAALLACVV